MGNIPHVQERMTGDKPAIGIVTSPFLSRAGIVPLSNLIDVLASLSDRLYILTGNAEVASSLTKRDNAQICLIERKQETRGFIKTAKYIRANLKISYKLVKLSKKTGVWFFYLGEKPLLMPLLVTRLLGKKTIFVSSGSLIKIPERGLDNPLALLIADFLENANHILANKIVISSEKLISERDLQKYKGKILIASEHFVDVDKFRTQMRLGERGDLVGYIGRLSQEKGVLNFIEAITGVLEVRDETTFLIGGDGQLRTKVEERLSNRNLSSKAKFVGWIPHEELPSYLGKLKLLVIPSYTETGPYIAFEAMACGTPVLATPVGIIPDLIKDGETGFIMEDNSPDCIATNIIRALRYPNLEEIAQNGRALVEKEYNYEKAVERYMGVFSNLNIGERKVDRRQIPE